ncbi:MAG: winged helix-turn-helix domain-containing protein [Glaciecola sp.]
MSNQDIPENGYFRFGEYSIDVGDNRVFHGSESRHIEPKAMQVLYCLALSARETVSRQELMDKVWQGRVVLEDALTRVISQLRHIFNDSKTRQLIQTVPKKGYRLSADVVWLQRHEFSSSAKPSNDISDVPVEPKTRKQSILITAAVVLLAIVGVFSYDYMSDTQVPSDYQEAPEASNDILLGFLPWRNLTGDINNNYLAEMLPEELSVSIAKSDKIQVLAHSASLALATDTNAFELMLQQPKLAYWVEGSITQANTQIRVLVRVVDKHTRNTVFSEVYKANMQEVLRLNASIVSDITQQLLGTSSHQVPNSIKGNVNVEAYRAYLQGNYWWMNGTTSEWFYRASAAFTKATQLDPNFAPAFGSLAFIYARYNYHDVHMDSTQALEKAYAAVDRALLLDPQDVNGLIASALLAIQGMQFDKAEQYLLSVLKLDSENARAHYVYSELALAQNELDKALEYAEQSLSIEPLSSWINVNKAIVHFWRNEMDKALASVEKAIKIDRNYTWAYVWKAKILHQMGNINEAIKAMQACLQIDNASPLNNIYSALLYTQADALEEANTLLAHTASLYGDAVDASFWKNYHNIVAQHADLEVSRQLLAQITLKDTRFFSLIPLQQQIAKLNPDTLDTTITQLLQAVKYNKSAKYFVNFSNHNSAYAALNLMRFANNQDYAQTIELLQFAINNFERNIAPSLRANNTPL